MLFRRYAIPHQIVLSKVDKVLAKKKNQVKTGVSTAGIASLQKMLHGLRPVVQPVGPDVEGPGALGEILTCSAETTMGPGLSHALGVSALRWAILSAAGLDGKVEAAPVADVSAPS